METRETTTIAFLDRQDQMHRTKESADRADFERAFFVTNKNYSGHRYLDKENFNKLSPETLQKILEEVYN